MPKISDKDLWQAEYDADTMARYEEIMADNKRKQAAIKAARKKAEQLEKGYVNMKKVAGNKRGR